MNKNIRDKINYAVEIINSIETDNLEKAKEINQLYDNIGEEESFNVNNMLILYFKNIFINKNYNLFNNTFFYYIENLRTFKTDNIHLYYSIFYKLSIITLTTSFRFYTFTLTATLTFIFIPDFLICIFYFLLFLCRDDLLCL